MCEHSHNISHPLSLWTPNAFHHYSFTPSYFVPPALSAMKVVLLLLLPLLAAAAAPRKLLLNPKETLAGERGGVEWGS